MRRRSSDFCRGGFSLVELLVVIGIIAVLLGILLPSLRKVKDHANQLVCLNNLRQIGIAFIAYTQNNEDKFPRPAVTGDIQFEDWIYWQAGRDLNQSRIVPYLGDRFDPNIFRCPADDVNTHVQKPLYGFSYSANGNILANRLALKKDPSGKYPTQSINRNQIRDSTRCILLVEESDQTVDDGCWSWQGGVSGGVAGAGTNVSSVRHDRDNIGQENVSNPTALTNGRSNVGFCDGHADFIPRADTFNRLFWDPKYNP